MASITEAMGEMKGVGREESIALASYLQRSVLRTEHLLEDILSSGALEDMKRGSSNEGQKMIDRIIDLAKEAKGKSAAETTEINGRITAIVKTLEKSGKDGAKLVKGLKKSGVIDAVKERSSVGSLFADEIKGKVEGFKDSMIRKLPIVGDIIANVRKSHIAGKQAEASELAQDKSAEESGLIKDEEEKQTADVAHKDAADSKKALEKVADATSSTAESTGGIEDATTEEEYDAGEEANEANKKKQQGKLGKMFGGLSGLFSGRRKEGGGGGGGGGISGMLPALIGSMGGASMIALLAGIAGPVILGVLAVGAGAAIGSWIYNNWVGPWQDRRAKEKLDASNATSTFDAVQSTMIEESTGEKEDAFYTPEGHSAKGKRSAISKTEATAFAKEQNMSLEELESSGGITRAMATVNRATGEAMHGTTVDLGSVADQEKAFTKRETETKDEHGKNKAANTIAIKLKDQINLMYVLLRNPVTDVQKANDQGQAVLDNIKDAWDRADEFKRDGRISADEFEELEEGFSMAAPRFVTPKNKSMWRPSADKEDGMRFIDGESFMSGLGGAKWKLSDFKEAYGDKGHNYKLHEGGVISGTRDITATLRPNEAVIPLDDPDTLQMLRMITANAMVKGTSNSGSGGGGSNTVIAPTTSTTAINTNNVFASSPTTRNPEKTYNRVSYQ